MGDGLGSFGVDSGSPSGEKEDVKVEHAAHA